MSSRGDVANNFALRHAISVNPDNEEHLLSLLAAQQLPSWWNTTPRWFKDGYEKDEMAYSCEQVQHVPFLLSGRRPAVGQRLYIGLTYDHDGSHAQFYRGWARMVGEVTKVGFLLSICIRAHTHKLLYDVITLTKLNLF